MDRTVLRNVDPAAYVPVPSAGRADVADEVDFVTMSTLSWKEKCSQPPNQMSLVPSESRFLVVVPSPGHPGAIAQLAQVVRIARVYDALPIIEVDSDYVPSSYLVSLPDVLEVYPALGNVDWTRTFAVGLNWLAGIAARQREEASGPLLGQEPITPMGYPVVEEEDGSWLIAWDDFLMWRTDAAIVPVVNISMGLKSPHFPFKPNDLFNVATAGAKDEMLVVVAAGNCGAAGMSAWALSPWVLAVGATEDEEGTQLADYSSRGRPQDPTSGPDLVAWGHCVTKEGETLRGTSFAAPRVSVLARTTAAALLQLGRHVHLAQGDPPQGVPLVGEAMIDSFRVAPWRPEPTLVDLHRLPILGVHEDRVRELLEVTTATGLGLNVRVLPRLMREILIASAVAVPGRGPHEVGAGFVDAKLLCAHLAAVTGVDLVRWFGVPAPVDFRSLRQDVARKLESICVFDATELKRLMVVLQMTGPRIAYDVWTRRLASAPVSEVYLASLKPDELQGGLRIE